MKLFILLLIFIFGIKRNAGVDRQYDIYNKEFTFDILFQNGMQAYLENNWRICVELLEKSLHEFHRYYDTITSCRLDCEFEVKRMKPMFPENIDDLHFFESVIQKSLCMLKCRKKRQPDLQEYFVLDNWNKRAFLSRKPYEYLHVCYYKMNDLKQAATAAYTFLMADASNKIMRDNYNFYLSKIQDTGFEPRDLEEKVYQEDYLNGVESYNKGDFKKCVQHMEKSLYQLTRDIDECLIFCEGEFDHGWLPDFMSSIANHFTFCLRCKQNCTRNLSYLGGVYYDDLYASHYEYLQFSYFKINKIEDACRAAASFLVIHPTSEDMLNNIKFYKSLDKVESLFFIPRPEAKQFTVRQNYERQLLNFIDREFEDGTSAKSSQSNFESTNETDNLLKNSQSENGQCPAFKLAIYYDSEFRISQAKGINIMNKNFQIEYFPSLEIAELVRETNFNTLNYNNVMKSEFRGKPLQKTKRFIIDDVISEKECYVLTNLLEIAAINGDGYDGNDHPHTDTEYFAGLSLGRLALLSYFGIIEMEYLNTLINISNKIKEIVQENFETPTKKKIYFTYTHLSYRKPTGTLEFNETTLSHPIHADNCVISSEDESCLDDLPAFKWRHYSAILYLNDNFDGGEFIFSNDITGTNFECSVKPKCGRLVAFTSGKENKHGIKSVRNGARAAIGIWFTHDEDKKELDQELAPQVLDHIKNNGSLNDNFVEYLLKT